MTYKTYEEYKDSNIVWISEIPKDWETYKIKNIGSFFNGFGFPEKYQGNDNGDIPFLKVSDINNPFECIIDKGNNYVNFDLIKLMNWIPSSVNSIIFPKIGAALLKNHRKINKVKVIIDNNMSSFHSFDQFYYKYVYYIFKELNMADFDNNSTVPSVNFDLLKNFKFPISKNFMEQKQIADYLDKKTSEIDENIAKNKKLINLLEEKKTALINQVVTKGLDSNVRMKYSGIEWIGEIPEHWKCQKINTLASVRRGASPRPIDDPKYFDDNGTYSWVRISDVTSSEKYLKKTEQRLSSLGKSLSVPMEPGDIFVSIAGTVGKPIITNIKCCIHDGFVYFKNLDLHEGYLFYLFEGKESYKGLGKLGTQLNLNTETIGRIYIPVPPREEQKEIEVFLEQEINNINNIINKIQENIDLLEEYKVSMIHHIVTGKIDVRDEI